MFSNNGEISNHQTTRLLILDVFTGAVLFLPGTLARICGSGGLTALILGLLFTLADGALLAWSFRRCGSAYIPALGQGIGGHLLRWLYGIRCIGTFIFLIGMFTTVLNETFLYMMPKWLLIGGMVPVLIYGSLQGIEVRSRLAEILFYLVLVPIILIGMFSIPEGNFFRLLDMSGISLKGVVQGTLVTWVLMAPMEWMLYIAPAEKNDKVFQSFAKSIGVGGGLVLLIYGLCVAVLGVPGMAGEHWPTVILMQIVRIPGGFMSRQDGLMLSFWIFAMFMSLSGALSHGAKLLGRGRVKSRPWKVWVLGIAGGIVSWFLGLNREFLNLYFWWMLLSGAVLLGIVPWAAGMKKKRAGALILAVILAAGLTGCENYVELENRAFVMALGVDSGEAQTYKMTYTFPDLETLTGTKGGIKYPVTCLEGDSLDDCKKKYDSMSGKALDYGQVKVIVLGKAVAQNPEKMEKLLKEIKENPEFARTVLVCESVATGGEILALDTEVAGSVGIYLDEMFRNNGKKLGIEPVILNDLILKMDGSGEEIRIPKLFVYDKKPRILR